MYKLYYDMILLYIQIIRRARQNHLLEAYTNKDRSLDEVIVNCKEALHVSIKYTLHCSVLNLYIIHVYTIL